MDRGSNLRDASHWLIPAAFLLSVAAIVAAAVFVDSIGVGGLAAVVIAAVAVPGILYYRIIMGPLFRAGLPPAAAVALLQAVEGAAHARAITSAEGALIYGNRAYRALLGAGAAMVAPVDLATSDEDQSAMLARLAALVEDGKAASEEIGLAVSGGGVHWFLVNAQPLREAGGGAAAVWYLTDVTGRHALEAESRRQDRFRALNLDHAPVGFYCAGVDGRLLYVNATLAGWLEYTPEELMEGAVTLGDIGGEVREEEELPGWRVERKWRQFRTRAGETLPVEVIESMERDGETGALFSRSVVRDLREEWRTASGFDSAQSEIVSFYDQAPIGIAFVTPEGEVIDSNAAFRKLLDPEAAGESASGAPMHFVESVSIHDREELTAALEATLKGERSGGAPIEVSLSESPRRIAQAYISRLGAGDASARGVIVHLIDATEQKDLELRFAQSQKMQAVGQLAGGIAHDFNNLLTAILGFCDLLLVRHRAGDASFADIMQIRQNANRAANLVRQLLAFSRQQTLRPTVLALTDVLAELSNLLRRLIGENTELEMNHGRNLHLVKVDQGQLEQVIINLAVNARDAMPDGGRLSIHTTNVGAGDVAGIDGVPEGDYVLIEMTDTGTGIPEENLDKIFEPFFTTKEVGRGTGLGLSTVYGIIEQTGGYILAESTLGESTTFRIFLPRYEPTQAELRDFQAEEPDKEDVRDLTGRETILLVEDEDPVRTFAARALSNKGYEVLEAADGESAIEIIDGHEGDIELLISDVVMPRMDGPTLLKYAREKRKDIKCILISGYAEGDSHRQIDGEADFAFLPKPFSLKQLAGKVKEVLWED